MIQPGSHPKLPRLPRPGLSATRPGRNALDSPHPLVRTPAVAGLAVRAGRWVLPWAYGLGISATLACMLNTAVVGALSAAPAAAAERADAGSRWVILSSVDAAGTP